MNRREFLKFLGGAAATAAVAPAALAEAFESRIGPPAGCIPPQGPPGNFVGGFIVLEPGMSVQEAIDALPAAGGTVFLKEGTYLVNESITIPEGVTLVARGNLTVANCYFRAEPRKDAPIWVLMEEDENVAIMHNGFEYKESRPSNSWFYVPVGEELERVKRSIFDLYLRFKKLIV